MGSDDQQRSGQGAAMADWMKSAMDFWMSTASMWSEVSSRSGSPENSRSSLGDDFRTRSQEAWQQPLKLIQALMNTLGDAEGLGAFIKGTGAFPDVMTRLFRTGCDSCFQLYQQWIKKIGELGESTEPYRFDNLDKDMFKGWMEIYQREIQPLLNAPQLGLNRFYQERVLQAMDKYILKQAAVAELMQLLYLPMEKSLRVMEKKIEELSAEGRLSENFKDYYNMWIKVLEGHYMTLFKSPDYLEALARTLNSVEDFKMAQHKMLADAIQVLPIPTNREMDDLYRELYLLKKQVKELSRRLETDESATG
jgi:class III poly(R)-hydroxyalkanoic acid synthase PhaE subunit